MAPLLQLRIGSALFNRDRSRAGVLGAFVRLRDGRAACITSGSIFSEEGEPAVCEDAERRAVFIGVVFRRRATSRRDFAVVVLDPAVVDVAGCKNVLVLKKTWTLRNDCPVTGFAGEADVRQGSVVFIVRDGTLLQWNVFDVSHSGPTLTLRQANGLILCHLTDGRLRSVGRTGEPLVIVSPTEWSCRLLGILWGRIDRSPLYTPAWRLFDRAASGSFTPAWQFVAPGGALSPEHAEDTGPDDDEPAAAGVWGAAQRVLGALFPEV